MGRVLYGLGMRRRLLLCELFLLCGLLPLAVRAEPPEQLIELFTRQGCPHCAAARAFLTGLQAERPGLRVEEHDVVREPAALARLEGLAEAQGVEPLGVPAFLVRGRLLVGFSSPDTTGAQLRALLDAEAPGEGAGAACPATAPCPPPASVALPWGGQLRLDELGLPAFTLVLGLLDGFNPCAMWVLLLLLSLLVNLRSRRRMLLVGGTFVLVSGLVSFLFMAAWLHVFLFLGLSRTLQLVLAGVALAMGALNLKDALAPGHGPSLSIPASARPGLYAQVRGLLRKRHVLPLLGGVAALAVLVNLVELACTAGLPALYTAILSAQQVPRWQHYAYLALYDVAYVLDDTAMLLIAVITLGRRKLQERTGRWLKLLSGTVMLLLGALLVLRPDWLARLGGPTG